VIDLRPPKPSRARRLLDRLPPRVSHLVGTAGFEGDVMPSVLALANKETRQERFEFGLDCMLDGIAARIAR
jgi:hypothetical protein